MDTKLQATLQELEEQRAWALTRAATIRGELSQKIKDLEDEIENLKQGLKEKEE